VTTYHTAVARLDEGREGVQRLAAAAGVVEQVDFFDAAVDRDHVGHRQVRINVLLGKQQLVARSADTVQLL